jgi:phenylpyruvate tautomerase PptA (4-oxalocrotonate tautomerase family)
LEQSVMPLVKISLLKGRSIAEKAAIIEAVHSALMAAFKIPAHDRNLRIFEFDKEIPLDNWGLLRLLRRIRSRVMPLVIPYALVASEKAAAAGKPLADPGENG